MVDGRQDLAGSHLYTNEVYGPLLSFQFHWLTLLDLGLQVLDDVISTRWKVLPRDQCQGMRCCQRMKELADSYSRHQKLCCQPHPRRIEVGRVIEGESDLRQQAEPSPRLDPKAGMAAELAYIYQ